MKRITFSGGVIFAALLAFFTSAFAATLTPMLGPGTVMRLVIPALALVYLLFLLGRSSERVGRVTTLLAWGALTVLTWWAAPSLPVYFLVHVAAVWLVRSLYFYSGFVPALMDLGLSALSVSAAVWAISRTGSIFLATWCFFLVQALFVAIPVSIKPPRAREHAGTARADRFEAARRQADRALRQLITR